MGFPFYVYNYFFSIKYIFESKKHFKNSTYKFSLVLFIQIFVIISPHVSFLKISKEKIIIKENDELITLVYKPKKRFNSSFIHIVHKYELLIGKIDLL